MTTKEPSSFVKKVWELALSIPAGKVTTYGYLTVAAGGHPMMAQMITHILSKCPNEKDIPYHRIVYASGKVWMSEKYRKQRLKLYKKEGIIVDNKDRILNFSDILWTFS
jgi:methylated-DNA-protein-cysteine methyltransferase-like protein